MSNHSFSNHKQERVKERRTTIIVILAAVLLLAALITTVLLLNRKMQRELPETASEQLQTETHIQPTEESEIEETDRFPFEIPGFHLLEETDFGAVNDQLSILGAGVYTGPYYEDASEDSVNDILAIVVHNFSEEWVINADISLKNGDQTANFVATGLPGSSCVLLLEQNRMKFDSELMLTEPKCSFCSTQTDEKTDFGQDFYLEPHDEGILVLQNVTNHDFTNDVLLYYKNFSTYGLNGEALYLGGITYRVRFPAPIAAGAVVQAQSSHYSLTNSAILYMQYDE